MAESYWSNIHPDLLEQVVTKLDDIEDFTAFRQVCTSWRGVAAAAKDNLMFRTRKLPLLMFPTTEGGDSFELYSLRSKKKMASITPVPEIQGRKLTGVGFGWILTTESSTGEPSLVNPMSSSAKIFRLPNMKTFPGYEVVDDHDSWYNMQKAVLSANPSETSDFMLMVTVGMNFGLWRNGDTEWTDIGKFNVDVYRSICYCERKFYAICDQSRVLFIWDPCLNKIQYIRRHGNCKDHEKANHSYLVESSKGELLLIYKYEDPDLRFPGYHVTAIEIDEEKWSFECKKKSLDGDAIFIDGKSAISVDAADFPGIVKANCIYEHDSNKIFNEESMGYESDQYIDGEQYHTIDHLQPQWLL